jgi:hypothetical protein
MLTQTFYKDFSIYYFNLKMEERRRLPSQLSFPNRSFSDLANSFARLTYSRYLRLHFALDANILRFLNLQHAIYVIRIVEDFIVNHLEERAVYGNRRVRGEDANVLHHDFARIGQAVTVLRNVLGETYVRHLIPLESGEHTVCR